MSKWIVVLLILLLNGCGAGSESSNNSPTPQVTASPRVTPSPSFNPTAAPTATPVPTLTPSPTPSVTSLPFNVLINQEEAREAVRFLNQATFGAKEEEVRALMNSSYETWLFEQMAIPQTVLLPLVDDRIRSVGLDPFDKSNDVDAYVKELQRSDIWWDTIIFEDDQLRQRVAFALSQIFVVSNVSDTLFHDARGIADYHDMLARHAFGNFRELMEDVTLHPMMGEYLSMIRNEKADLARNIRPDENYARELMQLFSIGLEMLSEDGTEMRDDQGEPIATYNQETIKAFARVFTGWMYGNAPIWYWFEWLATSEVIPMVAFDNFHDTDEKTLLNGQVIPAGQTARQDLEDALDNIFAHQNVAPFISKQLIQRLITSNPSPAYVQRVASVFNDNGENVKGDLSAVIRAIYLDEEARNGHNLAPESFGKLKEPILKLAEIFRAFDVQGIHTIDENQNISANPVIRLYGSGREMGQRPYGSPSVFNFYRPEFSQTGEIRDNELASPEFQILTENHITAMTNRISSAAYGEFTTPETFNALWDVGFVLLDFSDEKALADSTQELIDQFNLLLMAGQMSDQMETLLFDYIESIPPVDETLINLRVFETMNLIGTSPEFAVQR